MAPHAFPPHEVASGESTNPDREALTDLRPAMHTPGPCWSRSAAPAAGGARRGTLIAATMARTANNHGVQTQEGERYGAPDHLHVRCIGMPTARQTPEQQSDF